MLHPLQMRLSEADRKEYGGPEWLSVTVSMFTEVRASKLTDWEQQSGVKVLELCNGNVDPTAVSTIRATAWYARQLAGLAEPVYAEFDPHPLGIDIAPLVSRSEVADVDPPASSSADNSAETPPAAKPKASRSQRG